MFSQVNISEYNPFTKAYALTEDYDSKKIELLDGYIVLSALTPGRCLKVEALAYEDDTTFAADVKYFNPFLRVTCGCPSSFLDELATTEPTGSPGNFTLQQVSERIKLSAF
jgi:hypothetical protein